MNRILLSLLLLLLSMPIYAQTSNFEDAANKAFIQGEYADAIKIYKYLIESEENKTLQQKYKNKQNAAISCSQNYKNALSSYNSVRYTNAISYLNTLLKLNPNDASAKDLLAKAKSKRSAYYANQGTQSKNMLDGYIKNNDLKALEQFAKNNPSHKSTATINELVSYNKDPNSYEIIKTYTEKLKIYGDIGLFYYNQNKTLAAKFFEKSAQNGNLSSFYNLAISLPNISAERKKRLVTFAAAKGLNSAKSLAKKQYPNVTYDSDDAQVLIQHLVNATQPFYTTAPANNNSSSAKSGKVLFYPTYLESKVYIQKYRHLIGLDNLDVIKDSDIKYILDSKNGYRRSHNPNVLYELARMYEEGKGVAKNKELSEECYFVAAENGHLEALYKSATISLSDEYKKAARMCAAIRGHKQAQAEIAYMKHSALSREGLQEYVKFLSDKKCNYSKVLVFLLYNDFYIKDNDSRLIAQLGRALSLGSLTKKDYNLLIKTIKTQKYWDTRTISTLKEMIPRSGKYEKLLKSKLTKVKCKNNIRAYDQFKRLVILGLGNNTTVDKEIKVNDFIR